jgi:hypothetical protein
MSDNKLEKYLKLRDSVKDVNMNNILDKILSGEEISNRETDFLSKYEDVLDLELSDLSYLSKNITFNKISDLIDKGKKVLCDLCDRNGKINNYILSIDNNFESDICTLISNKGDKITLNDNFLYNIKYNFKKDIYVLTKQDEFFEKIEIDNE